MLTTSARRVPRRALLRFGLWEHRSLVRALAGREIAARYRGSVLGLAWSFLTPLAMLAVYTFVFTEVFRMRWSPSDTTREQFAIVLFAGLLVFSIFADCLTRAPGLVVANANYVGKIVFPLHILAWVVLASALFHFAVGVGLLLLAQALLAGVLPPTAVLLPVVLLPFLLFCVGLVWGAAALGVFFRDLGQIAGLLVSVAMFLSPLFYPAAAVPEAYRWLLDLNPLTLPIEQARAVLVWGTAPDWTAWALYLAFGAAVAVGGLWGFQRARPGFSDVL